MSDNKDDNNTQEKVNAVLGLLILLLLGVLLGCLLDRAFQPVTNVPRYVPKQERVSAFDTIKSVVMMPLYYLISYPSMLMNISDDGSFDYPQQSQQPQKLQKRVIRPSDIQNMRRNRR